MSFKIHKALGLGLIVSLGIFFVIIIIINYTTRNRAIHQLKEFASDKKNKFNL